MPASDLAMDGFSATQSTFIVGAAGEDKSEDLRAATLVDASLKLKVRSGDDQRNGCAAENSSGSRSVVDGVVSRSRGDGIDGEERGTEVATCSGCSGAASAS